MSPAVLLLHGLGGDRHQALGLLPPGLNVTPIAPDLPGHGERDLVAGEPVSFPAFAALVAERLDRPVPVVGVSMGAGIAVALAAARPDLVERLILIRPSWLDECPPPHLAAFVATAGLLESRGPEDGRAAFERTEVYRSIAAEAPAMASSLLGQFARPHAVARARVLRDMPHSLPLTGGREAYRTLPPDTVVAAAPHDPVHPEGLARTLAGWIPGARFTLLPRKLADPAEHQAGLHRLLAAELAPSRRAAAGS